MIDWTLAAFDRATQVSELLVVLHPEDMDLAATLTAAKPLRCVSGGATRSASVACALAAVADPEAIVLIHDAARPVVSADLIARVVAGVIETGAAAPALPVVDALWTGAGDRVTGMQPRDGLYRAQTPQGFHAGAIRDAHAAATGAAADDVEIARAAGMPVAIVAGDEIGRAHV